MKSCYQQRCHRVQSRFLFRTRAPTEILTAQHGGPMEVFLNSFLLVFAGEMGDKTQLLALILATKYRKPWTILAGVFVATLLNHALASYLGEWLSLWISATNLKWILIALFVGFAFWILIPDKQEDVQKESRYGAFLTTLFLFFMAEMGDKTQFATVALGARYNDVVNVTLGTTLGMMGSNALAIFLGPQLLARLSMTWVRRGACLLFLAFAAAIYISM